MGLWQIRPRLQEPGDVRTSIEVIVEVEIERPPSVVWSFITDAERLPEWFDEFEAAHEESGGPAGVGTVVRYTVAPGHRTGTFETVEWDPPRRVAWDGPPLRWAGGGARPRGSHALAQAGEGRTLFVGHYRPRPSSRRPATPRAETPTARGSG